MKQIIFGVRTFVPFVSLSTRRRKEASNSTKPTWMSSPSPALARGDGRIASILICFPLSTEHTTLCRKCVQPLNLRVERCCCSACFGFATLALLAELFDAGFFLLSLSAMLQRKHRSSNITYVASHRSAICDNNSEHESLTTPDMLDDEYDEAEFNDWLIYNNDDDDVDEERRMRQEARQQQRQQELEQQRQQEEQRQRKQREEEQKQQQKQREQKQKSDEAEQQQQHDDEDSSSNYFEELVKEIFGQVKSDFNAILNVLPQTVQAPIRSAGSLVGRTVSSVGKPAFQQVTKQGAAAFKVGVKAGKKAVNFTQQQLIPKAKQLVQKTKQKLQEVQAKKAAEKAAAEKRDVDNDVDIDIAVDIPEDLFGHGYDTDEGDDVMVY
eukprot:5713-Heterococcus_DN1.PRE.1